MNFTVATAVLGPDDDGGDAATEGAHVGAADVVETVVGEVGATSAHTVAPPWGGGYLSPPPPHVSTMRRDSHIQAPPPPQVLLLGRPTVAPVLGLDDRLRDQGVFELEVGLGPSHSPSP